MKQALINLSKESLVEPDTRETFQSVYAILFFGVPCKGLDGERLGLAAMVKGQSTEGFLSDLRQNSPMVNRLAQDFLEVFNDRPWVRIYSFHETVESGTAVLVSFLALYALNLLNFPVELLGNSLYDRTNEALGRQGCCIQWARG